MSKVDLKEFREELARIDAAWTTVAFRADSGVTASYDAARSALDRALAALEAGWPVVDIDAEACAQWRLDAGISDHAPDGWFNASDAERVRYRERIVSRLTGRKVEPACAPVSRTYRQTTDIEHDSPELAACASAGLTEAATISFMARALADSERHRADLALNGIPRMTVTLPTPRPITDAMVEEAAIRAWCSNHGDTRGSWVNGGDKDRQACRNEARAVLEYAASLGIVAPVANAARVVAPSPTTQESVHRWASIQRTATPATDARAERLTRHRHSAAVLVAASMPRSNDWLGEEIAGRVEDLAHAMLAAEKEPARG